MKQVLVRTFGCQMNAHDSERIMGMLSVMGYEAANDEKDADIIVYNTCCVRENAENKLYGHLGRIKKLKERRKEEKRADITLILCGCMMQQAHVLERIQGSYPFVNVVAGTFNITRLPELLRTYDETGKQTVEVWDSHKDEPLSNTAETEAADEAATVYRANPYKASVNIMYGCDNFCSYCVVPYVRGRERSRTPSEILAEARILAKDGVKEITLLGQNVNSYGKGTETDFAALLEILCEDEGLTGIERIRFMTSHPKDLSDRLIDVIAKPRLGGPRIAHHIHLPLQSGSTRLLGLMNRGYTKERYMELAQCIKAKIPDISLTTDIIVGFPGETDEDFAETLDVVKRVRFAGAYTFLYSPRKGTKAETMDGQVPDNVASERFKKLLDTINPIVSEENAKLVGQVAEVLPEELNEKEPSLITGRLESNTVVHFEGDTSDLGRMTNVRLIECKGFYFVGEKQKTKI